MKIDTAERDPNLTAAYFGVAAAGLVLLLGSGAWVGASAAASVGLGVVFALANLWIVERLVRAYIESERRPWALVALLKAAVLVAAVVFLVRSGGARVFPLVVGFGALPLGICITGLRPVAPRRGRS